MAKRVKSKKKATKTAKKKKATKVSARKVKKTKTKKKAKKTKRAKKAAPKKAKKATAAPRAFIPPYKCQTTLTPGVCIRFELDPHTGRYDQNPQRVPCSTCEHFF